MSEQAISVVVCAYNARRRIDVALRSLARQDLDEPFEVIVVASGSDGCAEYLAREHPQVRVMHSPERLWPGPARNRGVEAACGRYVAFLPDDGVAAPDWLRRRLDKHREGYAAVGGAIGNGTPRHPVGSAGYFLEYTALLACERVLAAQPIPHCLSYERELVVRLGGFPEDIPTGEDSVLNERLVRAGVAVGFEPRARLDHLNPTRLRAYLAHQYAHGRGLVRCVERHGHPSPIGPARSAGALGRALGRYPARRWLGALGRVARGRPRSLPEFILLTPLIWAGLWATAAGALAEWRAMGVR